MTNRALLAGLLMACVVLASGCSPSERAVYRIGREAVLAQPDIPEGARVSSRSDSTISVMKNAAFVRLTCEVAQGEKEQTRSYTVWVKRLARTWVLDRIGETPRYDTASPE